MADVVVTSVGAIDGLGFGSSVAYNLLTIAEVQGFSALGFLYSKVTLDISGAWIDFELDGLQDESMCFHFGSNARIAGGLGWDSAALGNLTVTPRWLIVAGEGWDGFTAGLPLVRPSPYEISFDLTEPLANAMALNLSWGDLVASVGGVEFTQFGEALFETPFNARVETGIDGLGVGIAFVHYDEEIYFNFVDQAPAGFSFYFGEHLALGGTGWDSAQVGQGEVGSTWQHVGGNGFDATQFGVLRVAPTSGFLVLNLHHVFETNAENIPFYFGDAKGIAPVSFDELSVGTQFVSNKNRLVSVYGSRFLAFGQHEVEWSGTPVLQAQGWDSLGRANPIIYNAAQVVEFFPQFGLATPPMTQWGASAESDDPDEDGFKIYIRFPLVVNFRAEEGQENLPFTQWGCQEEEEEEEEDEVECTFQVAYSTRWVQLHYPHPGAYVGTAYIGYFDTTVWVPWAQHTVFGVPTVGRHTEFHAPAIYDGGVGQPTVAWGNVLWPVWPGSSAVVGGAKWISHSPRHLLVQQREISERHSAQTRVWNSLQFIVQYGGEDYNHKWEMGDRHHIYNVNRSLGVMGLNSLRMPVQFEGVWLAGRALQPPGLDATQYGDQLVADAIRYYTPLSWDSLFVSRYGNLVGNAALSFTPRGIEPTAAFGLAKAWDNRQWVRVWQFLAEEIGTQFVAFAEREVVQRPYAWALTTYGRPYIGLREQFINLAPTGPYDQERGDFLRLGEFDVVGREIPWFRPRWPNQPDDFGNAKVWNFNPQAWPWPIYTYGASERMWISHSPRYLEQPGRVPEVLGRPVVAFRDRQFEAFGHDSLWVGTGLQVRNAAPDPPKPLVVEVAGICLDYKADVCCSAFGRFVAQNNVLVVEGIEPPYIVEPWIRNQGCILKSFEHSSRFGRPLIVKPQTLIIQPFEGVPEGPFWEENYVPQATQWGKPLLSPQTIWCTPNISEQAEKNHPSSRPFCWPTCEYNSGNCRPCSPFFGEHTVSAQHRAVFVFHDYNSTAKDAAFGQHAVYNKTVYVKPESCGIGRAGFPLLIPHTKKIYGIGFRTGVTFSLHEVWNVQPTIPDPLTCNAIGTVFTQWGLAQLDPKTLWPEGFDATQWGDNNPMVHFPLVLYPQGFSATQWGDNWLSHWVRWLEMEGTEPPGWWMDDFDDRMQVIGGNQVNFNTDLIFMEGFTATEWGDWVMPVTEVQVTPYMIEPPCIPCHAFEIKHA